MTNKVCRSVYASVKREISISISTHAFAFICKEGHIGNWYIVVGKKIFHYTSLIWEFLFTIWIYYSKNNLNEK